MFFRKNKSSNITIDQPTESEIRELAYFIWLKETNRINVDELTSKIYWHKAENQIIESRKKMAMWNC
jgi:hypothetical protein